MSLRFALVATAFTVSGASALVYQVAWQRLLALHSGVGIYSVAVIVAAFMSGLGLGSYLGGRTSRGLSAGAALRGFALLELGIGCFALLSCELYYDLLYLRWRDLYRSGWSAGGLHFLALLVPTTMMGMSLPFLARAAVRDVLSASRTLGTLYGLNVVGAAAGALLTPWVLIRLLGIEGAVACGAAGNLLAGLCVLGLGRRAPRSGDGAEASARPPAASVAFAEPAGSRPLALWVALYAASGFCALALEILWFRVVDVAVKSTAFSFGTVLSLFLFGLAAGSLLGGRRAATLERPLRAFLTVQCALLAYAAAALIALVSLPSDWPVYADLLGYFARYEGIAFGGAADAGLALVLYGALPLFLYGPPTVLMGFSFAILQRAVQDDPRTSGFKVGLLQAANIAGNAAGSLLTGLVLLHFLGTPGSLRVLLGVGLGFAAIGAWLYGPGPRFAGAAALLLALLLGLPSGDELWQRLHGAPSGTALFEEDASAVSAATSERDGRLRISVNGKGHSWIPYGGPHTVLGAIPATLHPEPRDVAIIGLGSGDTAWSAAFREETERLTVFEIVGAQPDLLRRVAEGPLGRWVGRLLADPRLEIVAADGRNALMRSHMRYDVIEADALRPHSAYSGFLYSVEFFRLAASRLQPGGLMCSWVPTARIQRSFLEAFPHVLVFDGQIMVGGNRPIPVEGREWLRRLSTPRANSYLDERLLRKIKSTVLTVRRPNRDLFETFQANTDLHPRDEFRAPLD